MPNGKPDSNGREVLTLQEYASSRDVSLAIDRERGIVRGVKVFSPKSRNDGGTREYSPKATAQLLKLYEGAPVFIDHSGEPHRSYKDRNGTLTNPRAMPDGIYADHAYNPKHPITEQYLYDAEHAPGNVGFSHNIEGEVSRKDGRVIVEEVVSLYSVDLVARPATTSGLFEGAGAISDDLEQRNLCEHGLSAVSDARTVLTGSSSVAIKKERLLEILAVWQEELAGKPTQKEKSTMEWTDITESTLRDNRPDIVAKMTGQDDISKLRAEVATLTEAVASRDAKLKQASDELRQAATEKAEQAKAITISEELKAAKLDATDKVVVSPAFMDTLSAAPDATARKRIIEDRVAVIGSRSTNTPGTAPFEKLGAGLPAGYAGPGRTAKETLSML
jgi:hypothetical protein